MSVNKVTLLGNLGRDPEVAFTASGNPVANLSVATSHRAKQPDGSYADVTEWHRVVVFGKSAEFAGEYLKKGRTVYIEGRLQTRKWQDQSGQDRYSTEIVCFDIKPIGRKDDIAQDSPEMVA